MPGHSFCLSYISSPDRQFICCCRGLLNQVKQVFVDINIFCRIAVHWIRCARAFHRAIGFHHISIVCIHIYIYISEYAFYRYSNGMELLFMCVKCYLFHKFCPKTKADIQLISILTNELACWYFLLRWTKCASIYSVKMELLCHRHPQMGSLV